MAESIKKVSQMAMTAYYKGPRPSNGPFRIEHFIFLCLAADSKIKQDEYDKERMLNIRMKILHADINLSPENYETVEVSLTKDQIKLPTPIMTFAGDKGALGVNLIQPTGQCKASFIRINPDEIWQICDVNDVVFWYPTGQCIKFINLEKICNPKKITVTYIPQITDKSFIQDSRKWAILTMVTQFIKAAENGTIIDMSNDGNANVASQTEINTYLLKALRNR